MSTAELLGKATDIIHAMFFYAACTEDGYVKVGISRTPFARLAAIHRGSPSPIRAAQWVWVGTMTVARKMELQVRRDWKDRHTRGEWYRFDYANPEDKRDFHDTLNAVFEAYTLKQPEWTRLGPEQTKELLKQNCRWPGENNRAA